MTRKQITDQELAQLLKEKAAGFKLSGEEKRAMKYNLMERVTISDVTKSIDQGYRWWKYQISFKGVAMPFLPILIAILLAGGAGTAVLADKAVPGDTLYPVDQWIEKAEVRLAASDTAKANLYAKFGEERLAELEQLSKTDPSKLSDAAKALWEKHHQEALDRVAQGIEQVTALQEKFQEKLKLAENDAQKKAFQKILDHLDQVKSRRDDRLDQLTQKTFPGVGPLPVREELKAWRATAKEEVQKIRDEIKQEFKDRQDNQNNQGGSESSNSQPATPGTDSVTSQALEFRVPIDENGNINWDLYDTDHDGIPDKYDPLPDWPPHTM
jgi:hypothetical protein